eukprot:scaffold17148_cov130-Amphora_coffeaeformis.AAC.1
MIQQSIPTFSQRRMGNCGTRDHRIVVSEQPGWAVQRDAERTEGVAKINDPFRGLTCCHKFRSVGCSLNLILTLAEPVNGCLVQETEDSSTGSPRNHVVHEVRINK